MAPYCEDIIMSEIEIREVGIRGRKNDALVGPCQLKPTEHSCPFQWLKKPRQLSSR
jgi:hypothetical protein